MKKVRFLFLVLALILVVGMTTGLIVRKQSGGQSVMQHSGGSAPVSTTPATTGDDPEEPDSQTVKILLLVNHVDDYEVTVREDGQVLQPIDTVYLSDYSPSKDETRSEWYYTSYVDRYLVLPGHTTVTVD